MRPKAPRENRVNRAHGYAVALCQLSPVGSRGTGSDCSDGFGGQDCATVAFPAAQARDFSGSVPIARGLPSLGYLVSLVLRVRPFEQVRRIATRRIVAPVETAGLRPAAVGEPERDAVGTLGAVVDLKGAVAGRETSSLPGPAFVRATACHLAPEALHGQATYQ